MSKEIHCPNCHAINTPGSKFCNNCGTRLPPSTSLICPNCETANARNRLYCDNCGTRLIQDAQTIPQTPEAEEQPTDKDSFFSLPIRPPGETGELDPTQKVPDWLKGQTDSGEESETEDEAPPPKHMPKIEEIGADKKMTDDLPDWLVDEHDSQPIIGSPRIITTEHYVGLTEELDNSETGDDLAESAEQANLPDWLTDLASPAGSNQVTTSSDQPTPDDALADWLVNISQSGLDGGDQTAGGDSAEDRTAKPGTTDSVPFPTSPPGEITGETADWLAELRAPDTGSLAGPETEDEEPALEDEMFDWFEEKMSDTGLLAEPTGGLTELPSEEDRDTGDWLTDFMDDSAPPDTSPLAEPTDAALEPAAAEPESEDWLTGFLSGDGTPPDTSGLADLAAAGADESHDQDTDRWADMDQFGRTNDQTLADLTDAVAQQDIGATDKVLSDWLAELPASDAAEAAAGTTDETDAEAHLPNWMSEFTASEAESFDEETESLLAVSEETAEPELEPETPTPTTDESEVIVATTGLTGEFENFLTGEDDNWQDTPAAAGEGEPEPPVMKQSGPLPDWLAGLGQDETLVSTAADDDDTLINDLFALDEDTGDDMAWLAEDETAVAPAGALPEPEAEPAAVLRGDTDWLSELVEMGDEAFKEEDEEPDKIVVAEETPSEEPEPAGDLFATDWPEEDEEPPPVLEEETAEPETSDSQWLKADTMLSDALQEELPDWLDELGAPMAGEQPPEEDEPLPTSDSLPDWIAQMKPGTVYSGSGLSDSMGLSDVVEPLPDLPEDMSPADLPEWLQEAASSALSDETTPGEEDSDIPGWLKSEGGDSFDSKQFGLGSQPPPDSAGDDWTAVLQELPAATAQDRIVLADIPDWIQALKPPELTGAEPEPEPEKPATETGPLAGIRDVIDIEPVIAQPRANGALRSFTVTGEQQAQTILLKQLALAEQAMPTRVGAGDTAPSGWVRVLLAALLLATILLGLLQPDLLARVPMTAPGHVEMAYTAVQEAAGRPVLLAVEYTPALSGELDVQAKMLIDQLAANGSPVITVSQYAAGTAVARALAGDSPSLGLVPGESVGLRQLGDCLSGAAPCSTVTGRAVPAATQQTLADVGLIIVLTGERDSLVNWLEQVGRTSEAPLLAGITQSLGPVAAPYFASGQLQGMVVGMPDTAVYQQEYLSQPTAVVNQQLNAQALAQILVAALLLVGGLGYGAMALFERGKSV